MVYPLEILTKSLDSYVCGTQVEKPEFRICKERPNKKLDL